MCCAYFQLDWTKRMSCGDWQKWLRTQKKNTFWFRLIVPCNGHGSCLYRSIGEGVRYIYPSTCFVRSVARAEISPPPKTTVSARIWNHICTQLSTSTSICWIMPVISNGCCWLTTVVSRWATVTAKPSVGWISQIWQFTLKHFLFLIISTIPRNSRQHCFSFPLPESWLSPHCCSLLSLDCWLVCNDLPFQFGSLAIITHWFCPFPWSHNTSFTYYKYL